MDPWSMDPLRGPWTGPSKYGPGPWTPIFDTPKNTIENNKKLKEVNSKEIIHSNISNDNGNRTNWSSIWPEIIISVALKWIRSSTQEGPLYLF